MIFLASACLGAGLGCLAHIAAYRVSGSRGFGMFTGGTVGFGVSVLAMHAAGVSL